MKLLSVNVVRSVVRLFFLLSCTFLKKKKRFLRISFFLPGLGGCYDDVLIINL